MDNLISDVLKAQGMSENEAYEKLSTYYQMLAEGCTRAEARVVFRPENADAYLVKLVSSAIRGIIAKGFHPEEVEDAIMRYYNPSLPALPFRVSRYPLDTDDTMAVEEELEAFNRGGRCEG